MASSTHPQALYVSSSTCLAHSIIGHHKDEVEKILQNALDITRRPPPPPTFRHIPIRSVRNPHSFTPYTIESGELKYCQDCPEWKTESKAVPPYNLYGDKLVTDRTPYIRALDLEKIFEDLNNSTSSVPSKDLQDFSDSTVLTWCREEIWKCLQPIFLSNQIMFANMNQLKQKIGIQTDYRCRSDMADIRNPTTQHWAITQLKRKIIQVLIYESKTHGFYVNRVGEMGEVAVKSTIHKLLSNSNIPSLIFSGFRVSEYLIDTLRDLGITLPKDAEMDTTTFIPNGDKVDVSFIQTKVLLPSETEAIFEKKLKEKIEYSLMQTRKDLEAMLAVMPDICGSQLHQLNIKTFSAFPVTARSNKICDSCNEIIIFQNDLNGTKKPHKSTAQTLDDILKAQPLQRSPDLATKLELNTFQPPSTVSWDVYKSLCSRFVGVSSLHPMKDYSTFLEKQERQIQDVQNIVKKEPERALYLTPQQNMAINLHHFMVVGPFGSGKTTVLELSLQNILRKFTHHPRHIFLVVWDESENLKQRFKSFESEGVKVFNRHEIFETLGVELDTKKRLNSLNILCKVLAEKYKVTVTNPIFLLCDEMNPNPEASNLDNMDWRALDTSGLNLILSLKPLTSDFSPISSSSPPQVLSPSNLPIIRLSRVLRCTQAISNLVQGIFKCIPATGDSNYNPKRNFSLKKVTPGHEIHGQVPELVALPICNIAVPNSGCMASPSPSGWCDKPVEHLIKPNIVALENILTRLITRDNIPHQDITVLVQTYDDTAALAWLVNHFRHTQVQVKTLDQFRGMESPVLIFVSDRNGTIFSRDLADALEGITRVTSRLIIVFKDTRGGHGLSDILIRMVKQGLAVDFYDTPDLPVWR